MVKLIDGNLVINYNIQTVEDLGEIFNPNSEYQRFTTGCIFRGISSTKYELIPSALRLANVDKIYPPKKGQEQVLDFPNTYQVQAEYAYLRSFYIYTDKNGLVLPECERLRENFFSESDLKNILSLELYNDWLPSDLYEVAALAQHYGLLTRLLDWTYDIRIALYFAAYNCFIKNQGKEKVEEDDKFVIWCFNAKQVNILKSSYNLGYLEWEMPVSFITPSYYKNMNLRAQKGVLTVVKNYSEKIENILDDSTPVNRKSLDQIVIDKVMSDSKTYKGIGDITYFYKIEIPATLARSTLKLLDKVGINHASIFPGHASIAKYILEKAIIYNDPNDRTDFIIP